MSNVGRLNNHSMVELLIVLIQFLIEVVGQAVISMPFDWSWRSHENLEEDPFAIGMFFLVVGGLSGWALAHLVPALVHRDELRVASLFASPILAGTIAKKIAISKLQTQNSSIVPKHHFWYAFVFTLGLAAVRFVYAK